MSDTVITGDRVPPSQHNRDRIRRAWSWIEASDAARSDDEKFIFLWIAFNAAYGREVRSSESASERTKFSDFLYAITSLDTEKTIYEIIWNIFPEQVRILLNNQYAFEPFWKCVRNEPESEGWHAKFRRENRKTHKNLSSRGVRAVHANLMVIFDRLYSVRNQVLHGGATFNKGWGRAQIRDGSQIMARLVPAILKIMQADIEQDPDSTRWG